MTFLSSLVQVLPAWKDLWQVSPNIIWAYQIRDAREKDVKYWEEKRQIWDQDWDNHWEQKARRDKGTAPIYRSGVALRLAADDTDRVKLLCIDCDNEQAVLTLFDKLVPHLDKLGLEYIWENSGEVGERGHLFLKTDCTLELQKAWVLAIFGAVDLDVYDKKLAYEVFPALKPNYLLRAPGGFHMRTQKVNSCTYKDRTGTTPLEIMQMFVDCVGLTEAVMRSHLVTTDNNRQVKLAPVRRALSFKRTFFYSQRRLPVPPGLPPVLERVASNCQAVNKILDMMVNDNYADNRGGDVHSAGLYLHGIAQYNDAILEGRFSPSGEDWAEKFFSEHRSRSHESHKWKTNKKYDEQGRTFASCKKWDEAFGLCGGCPFKGRVGFDTPKQLYWGKPVFKTDARPVELVSHDQVRQNTFPRAKERVKQLASSGARANMLLASPLGTGKSFWIDDCAVDLARSGKKILISCHSGEVAAEHKKRIDAAGRLHGVKSFMLGSQPNLFANLNPGFDCPHAAEIQVHRSLGLNASIYRERFCGGCPFADDCPYPTQYANCLEPEYQIVIVQHAHFTVPEAMAGILRKHFDVMFIDEAIVDALIKNMKATDLECTLVEQVDLPWAPDLARWMRKGGYPQSKKLITLELSEALRLSKYFSQYECPWRLPDFIRYYNQNMGMDTATGLWIFSPLPTDHIPLCVITDATPPKEIYQIMLDDDKLEVFGENEILDYTKMNPKNQVIQVLDKSMSKTSLRGPINEDGDYEYVRFCEILDFCCDKAKGDFKDKKILITVYGGEFWQVAERYIGRNYPDIGFGSRVVLGKMSVGTNKYEDCDVQFLIAGVYLSGKHFHDQAFKLKEMANYWNRVRGRPSLSNFFHYDLGEQAGIERQPEPVYRIESVMGHGYVFKYPEFSYYSPKETFKFLAERFAISKTQQSLRLRYNCNSERTTYIFGNYFLPSFLITDSVLEEDLLGYLRVMEE